MGQSIVLEIYITIWHILWLIGKLMGTESIVASAIATAGFIIGLFGLVGLISSFFRKKEQKNI